MVHYCPQLRFQINLKTRPSEMHSADTILAVDQGKSWSARTCVNLLVFRSQHPSTSSTLHLFPISKLLRQTSKMKLQESTILN